MFVQANPEWNRLKSAARLPFSKRLGRFVMQKTIKSFLKPLVRSIVAFGLVAVLVLGNAGGALAAGGGRIGGGSFRAPTRMPSSGRTYSAPRSYAPAPGYGYGYPGGGFGFPFVFPSPIFWVGGGGLFSLLIFLAVAGFLVQTFRRSQLEGGEGYETASPTISVAKLQIGLLSSARELQADLNKLAMNANTSSTAGLAAVLQETTLALLRHPQYWTHGSTSVSQARLAGAEAEFNRMLLSERSKFSGETLSNVNSQLKQAQTAGTLPGSGGALTQESGEYIVVTLMTGVQGKLDLPKINSTEDMRRALQQLGGVSSDRLLALEVLWTPQAESDVLTAEDFMVEYPDLKLI